MKIAVCFFGITRNLRSTIRSIQENILEPCAAVGEVKTFTHLFNQKHLQNPRSNEAANIDIADHALLKSDWYELEEPDTFLGDSSYAKVRQFGDYWDDDFRSLRNLFHQLHSLERVTRQCLEERFDLIVYARPDLLYHDSFEREIKNVIVDKRHNLVSLPNWQNWGDGFNDRFSICKGQLSAHIYGTRIGRSSTYCHRNGAALHAERLLRHAIEESPNVGVRFNSLRASRVRAGGEVKRESFLNRKIYIPLYRVSKAIGRSR